jgi:hypothetical protein
MDETNTFKAAKGPRVDPYINAANPKACVGLTAKLVHDIVGGEDFTASLSDAGAPELGFISNTGPDRAIIDLGGLKCKDDIDTIEVRASEFPNLVTVSFLKGGILARKSAKEGHEAGLDVDAAREKFEAEFVELYGPIPEHRNATGFYAVSAFHGVLFSEVLDLIRSQTGLAINVDPEWDASRQAHVEHTLSCDCDACKRTQKGRELLRQHYPDLRATDATVTMLTADKLEAFKAKRADEARKLAVEGSSAIN